MQKPYVLFLLLFFLPYIRGQESSTPGDKLIYGVYLMQEEDYNYSQPKELGFNTVVQYAKPSNIDSMMLFENSISYNWRNNNDYIVHYSAGYYKKWEAEENIDITNEGLISGIKHSFGTQNGNYWIVDENDEPGNNFIYGPHYNQDKKYRDRDYINPPYPVYKLKFRMRLLEPSQITQEVCRLRIVFTYYNLDTESTETYTFPNERIIYSNELSLSYDTDITMTYTYPDQFTPDEPGNIMKYTDADINYIDWEKGLGIQFIADWLGGPKIAVDYIEVYDQQIWGQYIDQPQDVIDNITNFVNSLGDLTNLTYWHSMDAPLTIDGYEPYRVIDEILNNINAKPLITDYHPGWKGEIGGRKTLPMWKELAQPKQLYLEYLPLWYEDSPNPHENIEYLFGDLLRSRMQEAHEAIPDYYFLAPVMAFRFGYGQPWYYTMSQSQHNHCS